MHFDPNYIIFKFKNALYLAYVAEVWPFAPPLVLAVPCFLRFRFPDSWFVFGVGFGLMRDVGIGIKIFSKCPLTKYILISDI